MRGSLIFTFNAHVERVDRGSTATDPDFREPIATRIFLPEVRVPCQVEPVVHDRWELLAAGFAPRTQLRLVCHFQDLERLGLVTELGQVAMGPGDRLCALTDVTGALVQRFEDPPGMYLSEARSSGYGLYRARPSRNLWIATFEDRMQGRRGG